MGILALLAFLLAFIFHGAGFNPDSWFNWQGMALLGLILLAWAILDFDIPVSLRKK
jgi:hypothetical protein